MVGVYTHRVCLCNWKTEISNCRVGFLSWYYCNSIPWGQKQTGSIWYFSAHSCAGPATSKSGHRWHGGSPSWWPPALSTGLTRSSLPGLYLEPAVQSSRDGHTLGRLGPAGGDGSDQGIKFISLLLQLLHQRLYCPLWERLALSSLPEGDNMEWEEKSTGTNLWHMRLCTMERQASALVGATEDIFVFFFNRPPPSSTSETEAN